MCFILRHFENPNNGLKQSYSNQQLSGVQLNESKEAMVTEAMRFEQGAIYALQFFPSQ